jgi:amino acid adenylation domain-containing protein
MSHSGTATVTAPGCIHSFFEEQAARTPAATALVSGAERLSYAELDRRANRLAGRLAEGVTRRGTVVGIYQERGPEMVVAVLATLKAGAGYLMLDPDFPAPRLRAMVQDGAANVVIVSADAAASLPGVKARFVRSADDGGRSFPPGAGGSRPDDVACVMFTSGSTGRPKGVATPHRAIVGTLAGQEYCSFGPGTVFLQCAPVSWDAFAFELWGALLFGGTCVLHPGQRPDPVVMARLAADHRVTTMYVSGSLFKVLVDEYPAALMGVHDLMVGGEPLSKAHVARLARRFPGVRVVNCYGPVENTMLVTAHPVTAESMARDSVPIGQPLPGKQVHVLDGRLQPVADGVVGELYATGEGLANGYVGLPAVTAERFVASPFGGPGGRMYRTGDLVRWHADGPLEFVGRADEQVKIRGFRVDPAEVESVLASHPAAERVAVVARDGEQGEKRLVAYVVSRSGPEHGPMDGVLRAHATALLPGFMVPSAFVTLDAFPLTANGKLDRSALPEPVARSGQHPYVEPRTNMERRVAGVWAQALGVERIGVHDNFFSLGGNSMIAVRVAARLVREEQLPAKAAQIFAAPTVAELAWTLARVPGGPEPGIPRLPRAPRRQNLPPGEV